MARLNIAERRLPQDGRIMLRVQGKELDLRVSTMPTAHGESVVMRLLDRETVVFDFERLGFTNAFLPQFQRVLEQPHGILRSEEHTSELQSLMRISYAVFCLKKKKH